MEKKYELTDETMNLCGGIILYRIRALKDFGDVKAGDLGGFIEKEDNLSHEGLCWVYDNAIVSGNALVYDDAEVYGNAWAYGNARIHGKAWVYGHAIVFDNAEVYDNAKVFNNARVSGNARIHGDAIVFGDAKVYDDAMIYGNAWVYGYAKVYGNAVVFGDTRVYGNARIHGNANIRSNADYITIGPIGSRDDYTTFCKGKDSIIYVSCGCFNDAIDKFIEAVNKTHRDNEFYRKQYLGLAEYIQEYIFK